MTINLLMVSLQSRPLLTFRDSARCSNAAENCLKPLANALHDDENVFQLVFSTRKFPLSSRTAFGRLNTGLDFFSFCGTFGSVFLRFIISRSGNRSSTSSRHLRRSPQRLMEASGRLKAVLRSCNFCRNSISNYRMNGERENGSRDALATHKFFEGFGCSTTRVSSLKVKASNVLTGKVPSCLRQVDAEAELQASRVVQLR